MANCELDINKLITEQHYVLGYHGCDRHVKQKILKEKDILRESKNKYDWLGHGIYFWEDDYERALEYAEHIKENPGHNKGAINTPDVIGAVLKLGNCLNLFHKRNLDLLRSSYFTMKDFHEQHKLPMPKNGDDKGNLSIRKLDCAVINFLIKTREKDKNDNPKSKIRTFDSVIAPFWEGDELFPGAVGFRERNHIQICIINKYKVYCLETGEIFNGGTVAGKKYGMHWCNVSMQCKNKGKDKRKKYPYHFIYYLDYLKQTQPELFR